MKDVSAEPWERLALLLSRDKSSLQKVTLQKHMLLDEHLSALASLLYSHHLLRTTLQKIHALQRQSPAQLYAPSPISQPQPQPRLLPELGPLDTPRESESDKNAEQEQWLQQVRALNHGVGGFEQLFRSLKSRTMVLMAKYEESGEIGEQMIEQAVQALKKRGRQAKFSPAVEEVVSHMEAMARLAGGCQLKQKYLTSEASHEFGVLFGESAVALFGTTLQSTSP